MGRTLVVHAGIQNLTVSGHASGDTVHPLIQRGLSIVQFLTAGIQISLGLFDLAGKSFCSLLQALLHTAFRFCELLTDSRMRIRQFFAHGYMSFGKLLAHVCLSLCKISVHLLNIGIHIQFQLMHLRRILRADCPVFLAVQSSTRRDGLAADIAVSRLRLIHDTEHLVLAVLIPCAAMLWHNASAHEFTHDFILPSAYSKDYQRLFRKQGGG